MAYGESRECQYLAPSKKMLVTPHPQDPNPLEVAIPSPRTAQAIRASTNPLDSAFPFKGLGAYGDDLGLGEAKSGFWGLLALKARSILDDDIIMSPTPHTFAQGLPTPQVAMATAAKAKLLLRELKTVKADLAFAKARCAQLEEENKLLRDKENWEKTFPNFSKMGNFLLFNLVK